MNINKISNTAFKGSLVFETKGMKYNIPNSKVDGILIGKGKPVFNDEIKDIMKIMDVPSDNSKFFGLELDADKIKKLSPDMVRYDIPNTDYQACFSFDRTLNTPEYTKVLAAYTAAKVSEPGVKIYV